MKRIIAIALLVPALAYAELTPNKGQFDPRVRVADYNAQNVVKLSTFYGVSTHVQFADGEVIRDVAVGDDQACKGEPRGNQLFTKPRAATCFTQKTSAFIGLPCI